MGKSRKRDIVDVGYELGKVSVYAASMRERYQLSYIYRETQGFGSVVVSFQTPQELACCGNTDL